MPDAADPFFDAYNRSDVAYGELPSPPLAAYLEQVGGSGQAFDLGAGAGRDTLALAQAGFQVTSFDLSPRGLARVRERAAAAGLAERVNTRVLDVREIEFPRSGLDAVVATTVLDHLSEDDARDVWRRMCDSLSDMGVMYVEVHTSEDPGSPIEPGCNSQAPVSETAWAVTNYFAPNQLATWATAAERRLRILRYEERLEWDYTHGPEHLHGKAILLAARQGFHPDWLGQPAAFPRRPS